MTSSLDLFSGVRSLEVAMDYHLDRQVLLNSNIANSDTPGYRPVDLGLVPADNPLRDPLGGDAGAVRLSSTAGESLDPASHPALLVPFVDAAESPGNDLNAVDLDRELAKLAANTLRYETAAELMARRMGALRYAAADGVGA